MQGAPESDECLVGTRHLLGLRKSVKCQPVRRDGGLPDAAGGFGAQGLALLAAEGLAKFFKVLHRAVAAPPAGGERISDRQLARDLAMSFYEPTPSAPSV